MPCLAAYNAPVMKSPCRTAILLVFSLAVAQTTSAADQWREVKSAHFTITSNASEGSAKTIAWQLEQIRSAISTLWPWAKVDLNRPLAIFVVKDENALKALAPMYWERKGGVRPATFWAAGVDQNYLAIRTDVEAENKLNINPYVSSYFSYVSLVLQQSLARPMPLWFSRGLAGVMSNTILRDSKIMLGPLIPWHLERLRNGARPTVQALVTTTNRSPELLRDDGMATFDATAWALVHYLMFGEQGARWERLDRFTQLVAQGTEADAAFRETLGPPEDLNNPLRIYISRNLFSFRQVNVDASVKRDGFTVRVLSPGEAAARQALLHVALRRPEEARKAIEDARKGQAGADAFAAEALLLDAEGKDDEAMAAYARAVEAGTTQPYAHYRLASLMWRSDASKETLVRIEQILNKAIALNNRYAAAYAMLGEARSVLGVGVPMSMVLRAISLEPAEPHYRLTAASVLRNERKYDEALKHAQAALSLADGEDERRRATEMIAALNKAKGLGG